MTDSEWRQVAGVYLGRSTMKDPRTGNERELTDTIRKELLGGQDRKLRGHWQGTTVCFGDYERKICRLKCKPPRMPNTGKWKEISKRGIVRKKARRKLKQRQDEDDEQFTSES
jgi:hypothetical protein